MIFITMKPLIKTLLREAIDGKEVSKKELSQLLNNISNNLAIKFLKGWIARGTGNIVKLSVREQNMLNLIKMGGPRPSDFSSKN